MKSNEEMPAWLSTCTTTQNQCVMYSVAVSDGVYT